MYKFIILNIFYIKIPGTLLVFFLKKKHKNKAVKNMTILIETSTHNRLFIHHSSHLIIIKDMQFIIDPPSS
jgi:predicted metallo-beta-lactamase superfamily hydrolase